MQMETGLPNCQMIKLQGKNILIMFYSDNLYQFKLQNIYCLRYWRTNIWIRQ